MTFNYEVRESIFGEIVISVAGKMICCLSGPMAKAAAETFLYRLEKGESEKGDKLDKWEKKGDE